MAQQFMTSSGAAVGPRIQEIDQTGVAVQRQVGLWRYVSWGAIIAGSVMAIATQMLLTLLGAGIGLVALGATARPADTDTATGFGIGAAIWWLVAGIISLWVGGVVAGRLSRVSQATDGVFHGLLVWALTTVLSIAVLTTAAANLVGGMFAALNQYIGATGEVPGVTQPMGAVGEPQRVGAAPDPAPAPGRGDPAADQRVGGLAGEPGTVDDRQVQETTQDAAQQLGQAALWSFFALTLGAVAGGIGGAMGRYMFSRYDEPTTVVSRTPMVHEHQRTSEPGGPTTGGTTTTNPNP